MANTPFFSDTAAIAALDALKALCNSGTIKVYTGTQPTDANTAVGAQTLLGTFTFSATAFGASAGSGTAPTRVATCTANAIADITAVAAGTAAWFRALQSNGTTVVFDGSVGVSGCDLNMTDVSISIGETMRVSSLTLSNPE
jgi:hypothetical protein